MGVQARVGAADYRWVILGATMLAQFVGGSTNQGIPALASFLQADLHMTRAEVGFLNSASASGMMISLMASGWLADLLGGRRVILVALLSIGCSVAAVSLGRSLLEVLLLLWVAGIATGMVSPTMPRAIVIWFPLRERGLAMGIQRSGIPLMGAVAAAVLPGLALLWGWRAALVSLGAVVAAGGLIVFALYNESPALGARPAPKAGRPPAPWKLFRNRNLLLGSILPAILAGVQFAVINYLVLYLREALAMPLVAAGGALAVTQTGAMAGRILWGVVSDRAFRGSRRNAMLLAGVLSSLLLGAMSFLPQGAPLWTVTLMGAALGLIPLGWNAVYAVFLPELAGKELAGSAAGLGFTLLQIGSIAVPPLFGFVVDQTGDYRWGWMALALAVAMGTALLLLVKESHKE